MVKHLMNSGPGIINLKSVYDSQSMVSLCKYFFKKTIESGLERLLITGEIERILDDNLSTFNDSNLQVTI
jgi:hypothetical protein